MRRHTQIFAGLLLSLAPAAALAHPGHHETATSMDNLRHLLSEPDHLMAAALLAALAFGGGAGLVFARRRVRK